MPPAVMTDFMTVIDHRLHRIGKTLDGVTGHVPAGLDAVFFKQRQQSRGGHTRTELTARNRARRRRTTRNKTRNPVKIKSQANDVLGHARIRKWERGNYSSHCRAHRALIRYHAQIH